jgi:hypothetical protein
MADRKAIIQEKVEKLVEKMKDLEVNSEAWKKARDKKKREQRAKHEGGSPQQMIPFGPTKAHVPQKQVPPEDFLLKFGHLFQQPEFLRFCKDQAKAGSINGTKARDAVFACFLSFLRERFGITELSEREGKVILRLGELPQRFIEGDSCGKLNFSHRSALKERIINFLDGNYAFVLLRLLEQRFPQFFHIFVELANEIADERSATEPKSEIARGGGAARDANERSATEPKSEVARGGGAVRGGGSARCAEAARVVAAKIPLGTVLEVLGLTSESTQKTITDVFPNFKNCEYKFGDHRAYLRFETPEDALQAVENTQHPDFLVCGVPEFRACLLTDEECQAYAEKVALIRAGTFMNPPKGEPKQRYCVRVHNETDLISRPPEGLVIPLSCVDGINLFFEDPVLALRARNGFSGAELLEGEARDKANHLAHQHYLTSKAGGNKQRKSD